MNKNKILHVMVSEKFMPPYIDFVDKYFGRDEHHYVFITSEKYEYGLIPEHEVEFLHTDDDIFITLLEYMKMAKKIILHGLWRDKINKLLVNNKELLTKCYWIIWGGDFFPPKNRHEEHIQVIKEISYLVTGTVGDYELIQKWYGAKGQHIFNIINYPSNLYKELIRYKKQKHIINILIGNSATSSNNHIEILKFLSKYKHKNIRIYAPLSYGDKNYANKISKLGRSIFKEKFIPINKFIPLSEYNNFLSTIDIAIFNHIRQQGAGNVYTLLSTKAKIYLNRKSNLYKTLNKFNIITYDTQKINLLLDDEEIREKNKIIAKTNFSDNSLIDSINLYIKHNSEI